MHTSDWSLVWRHTFSTAVLHLCGVGKLCQFLGPPKAHERPSGRQFEIAPLIDWQANLREGGGRQVLPLAGQLLDQLFEPRIVPDDHHGLGVLPPHWQQREDVFLVEDSLEPVESFETVDGRETWYTPWSGPADVRSIAVALKQRDLCERPRRRRHPIA